MKFNKSRYFGDLDKSRLPLLIDYISQIDNKLSDLHDYKFPLTKGDYSIDFFKYLKECELNDEPMSPEQLIEYMTYYFQNLPDWVNPGTMINVIPAVNLLSAAEADVAMLFNPNCAQDTYSGNLLVAELEVIKYMSDLIGWDWTQSTGIFTFGGTGTNLYATKLMILNVDETSKQEGIDKGCYFSITSQNGHPCHYQVCDWLGLGSNTCIEASCAETGEMDFIATEKIIRENLDNGKIFLGFNLTGGSTNEMIIDSVEEVYSLREKIISDYNMTYRPMIHVDSVLGWVYLFFKDYSFDDNPAGFDGQTLAVLQSLWNKVRSFRYADTMGIDFHKTGFCPYITSLFVVKEKEKYFKLNPSKAYDLKTMKYGDYNPFYVSLEYSRSPNGPIAALSCLKSLGKNAFCELIGDLVMASLYFRELLKANPDIFVILPQSEGYATIFSLVPKGMQLKNVEDVKKLSESDINYIKEMNVSFGKKVLGDCVKRKRKFIFTASRSYVLPGTNIKIGALKAYPMSVYFDKNQAKQIAEELTESIKEFYEDVKAKEYDGYDLFQDMSKEDK